MKFKTVVLCLKLLTVIVAMSLKLGQNFHQIMTAITNRILKF